MEYPSEYLYEALVQSTDDYVYICNMKTGFSVYSGAGKGFDLRRGSVLLLSTGRILCIRMTGIVFINPIWKSEKIKEMPIMWNFGQNRNGEYVWLRCRGHLIRDEYRNPALLAGSCTGWAARIRSIR